jgi:molecular chaperone GrpE
MNKMAEDKKNQDVDRTTTAEENAQDVKKDEKENNDLKIPFSLDDIPADQLKEYANMLISALTAENEQLMTEQAELKKQIEKGESYLNQLVILKNDFENYKRRSENALNCAQEEGKLYVVTKLMPVLDTFDKAREMLNEEEIATLDLIAKQFDKILSDVGVVKMDISNTPFDPNLANAVHKVEVEEEKDNMITEVYANGYRYGDRVLRYANVCVGVCSKKENNDQENGKQ